MMPISSKHTIAVILACLSSTLAFCQTDGLVLSSSAVSPGGTASLSLSLTSPAGSEPAGLQWTLVYSPTDIVALSALAGTSATAAGKSLSCAGSPGSYTCLLTGLNANIVQNGVVAVVTATISPSTTATSIAIANALGATQSASAEAITATGGTITTVVPLSLTFLSCNPVTVASGASTTCTVSLNQTASSGATVALSDNNALLTIPASVTVPAGASSARFIATAGALTTNQSATVTATLSGAPQTATLALVAPMLVTALACNPTSVNSGTSSTCTFALNQAAPTGGSVVALFDNNPSLTVPLSHSSGQCHLWHLHATAGTITTTKSATTTAAMSSSSKTALLTITPYSLLLALSSLQCRTSGLLSASSCTVTVDQAAPANSAVDQQRSVQCMNLISSKYAIAELFYAENQTNGA